MTTSPEGQKTATAKEGHMETSVQREWISLREMQEVLGIGSTKAYELVASGSIPGAVKIGRIIRINRRKLDNWLEQQTIDLENK